VYPRQSPSNTFQIGYIYTSDTSNMAGPKASSASGAQEQQQGKSESSYKAKLMQPSSHDDLSTPDQSQEKPKLEPAHDAGSPPMVPGEAEGRVGLLLTSAL